MKNKKRVFLLILFILFCTIPLFADDSDVTNLKRVWVNAPFVEMLSLFSGLENKWIIVAHDIAKVMFVIALVWNCLQLAFGTIEMRKAVVGMITKWCLFLFIMSMYPAINVGLLKFSGQVAQFVSNGWQHGMGENLAKYYEDLYKVVKLKGNETSALIALKQSQLDRLRYDKENYKKKIRESIEYLNNNARGYVYTNNIEEEVENKYNVAIMNAERELEAAKNTLKDGGDDVAMQTFFILRDVFTVTMNNSEKVTGWDIMLNGTLYKYYDGMEVEDNSKRKTGKAFKKGWFRKRATIDIISPDAVLKTVYLAAVVMWEREWTAVNNDWQENMDETEKNGSGLSKQITKKFTILDFPFQRIWEMIFCVILIIMMVICGCVAIIQYMMCLLEYTLIAGAAAIFIPFMLFDGVADMAQKLISTLLQQAVKLIFCVLIINFVLWCFFALTEQCVGAVTGLSLQNVVFGFFICIIGGAFMTNAPKIAVALVSGTPQMSMGEVLQMAGSYAAGAGLAARTGVKAAHLVTTAGKLGKEGLRRTAQGGIKTVGELGRIGGAMAGAYRASKDDVVNNGAATRKSEIAMNTIGAGFRQAGGDLWTNIKDGTKNFVTGGKGGSGGGGRGGSDGASGLNQTGKNLTNTSVDREKFSSPDYTGNDLSTAQAHNKTYGQSMHYEKNSHGQMEATRTKTLGEHIKTQTKDAAEEAYNRYKAYYDSQKKKNT